MNGNMNYIHNKDERSIHIEIDLDKKVAGQPSQSRQKRGKSTSYLRSQLLPVYSSFMGKRPEPIDFRFPIVPCFLVARSFWIVGTFRYTHFFPYTRYKVGSMYWTRCTARCTYIAPANLGHSRAYWTLSPR